MGNTIKFADLSEEKRRELQKAYSYLDKIITFSNKASLSLFNHLFGESIGEHLFVEVFVRRCNRDIVKFFNSINSDYKTIIFANIFGDESSSPSMYAYC